MKPRAALPYLTTEVRLMRIATALGPFHEAGPEEYQHTAFSKIYLQPELAGMLKILCVSPPLFYPHSSHRPSTHHQPKDTLTPASNDEHGPAYTHLHAHLSAHNWRNPTSATSNPYTHAHRTGGKDFWAHVSQFPARVRAFDDAMGAHTRASAWTVETYPFAGELSQFETDDETVLFVDIGGGKGHVTRHVRGLCKAVRGKMVFLDRKEVVEGVNAGEGEWAVEGRACDFFAGVPVKGESCLL